MSSSIPYTVDLPGGIPDTMRPHTERTTTILVPKANTAFLNPVQEYNRDLSVSVIRAWNEMRKEETEARWRKNLEKDSKKKSKGKGKGKEDKTGEVKDESKDEAKEEQPAAGPSTEVSFRSYQRPRLTAQRVFNPSKITILEALSATGLRSIRYAKEIPDVKVVLANDISPSACDAMRKNVALNGVGPAEEGVAAPEGDLGRRENCNGYVQVNEGDALTLMYAHRAGKDRVEVVDLDPYGTAAPFIDSAMGSIADGGLLCVTCTDLSVLAGSNYPEKAFSNYGGASANTEYSHEVALRLVLNSLAQAAARYGRHVTPLISLSIDFYVRLFVRIDTRAVEVKRLASKTGIVYACNYCQTPAVQPFGRIMEREGKKGNTNILYRHAQNNAGSSGRCDECGSHQHIAGPMWLGPLHDKDFIGRVLKSIEGQQANYGTWARMHGMLSLAQEELEDMFYFTSNKIHGFAHMTAQPTKTVVSALLNAGYKVSRSHAIGGSVKTNAPRSFVLDILREGLKTNPVRLDKVAENSPVRRLIAKPMTHTVDLTLNPDAKLFERDRSTVFYQLNPLPNWGPAPRARTVQVNEDGSEVPNKRKSEDGEAHEAEAEAKRAKVEAEADDEEAAMNA
ncbi:RNA methyltransferase tRNA(m5U54)methyltransferase [Apiotrichum porosum]|uniref:tRNA (guanine(26)-N(2))-dimethyltransferase n=1 Tax=Apiotrichum porosum TaxID=105984 RepID=A0A427XM18_9TREE|nr:RNA methyltransferase tRNA(m5U54)methyltransferase [Apiotrichum porosum]RSH79757.1 RNA methyltransferase tRNA(m5U54)methyltransferase [Apiotrichum porosum]